MQNDIILKGARQHNLKGFDLRIPRNKLIVITGLSGSGKSSLAFDTIYAEGQRRYVESLSAYARQFLDQMQKPDIEHIEGLSPAIAIEQRSAASNPRSTVATTTEIYDYLRLLYAHIGKPHCPKCKKELKGQSPEAICDKLLANKNNLKLIILAPIISGKKGEQKEVIDRARRDGFTRLRIDGQIYSLDDELPELLKNKRHSIELVIDRLVTGKIDKSRLNDSIELGLRCGEGNIIILLQKSSDSNEWIEEKISEKLTCLSCGISVGQILPRNFSFNSPYGACNVCNGLGTKLVFDPELIIPNPDISIRKGAIPAWRRGPRRLMIYYNHILKCIAEHYNFPQMMDVPFKEIPENIRSVLLYGSGEEVISFDYWRSGAIHKLSKPFEGILRNLERRMSETESDDVRERLRKYMRRIECPSCKGARLNPESLAVTIDSLSINKFNALTVKDAISFLSNLQLTEEEKKISKEIIKEILNRLKFLDDVGLSYLTLERESSTLSGGEAQRIRLATQIGSGLTGVIYILDEPSIGLHQRDNVRLIETLTKLRDIGNTVIVVEHDLETIENSDYVIDLGPGAGIHGGYLVAQGPPSQIKKNQNSLTGAYLSGKKSIPIPVKRQKGNGNYLIVRGARHNNLKNIDVKIPLGTFTCITGVSGSGKSSFVDETLRIALARHFGFSNEIPGKYDSIEGLENIGKFIVIDQSPIGRTPRSNPATYTGAFSLIRDIFSSLPEAKSRGYKPGRFSFNVKGGRCEECAGDGIKRIEMQFLPDVYITCGTCGGKRFNRETLTVLYKGKSIADVLEMTVEEACAFFKNLPSLHRKLKTLFDVGLGYIHLGQPATTLSGGEAQRVKLATELSRIPRGHTIYILDEPTTGLHIDDVKKLLEVLLKLRDQGNTVLVVEHNLEIIKTADWIIDLGPEGGEKGGEIVAEGTPESIARSKHSYTGKFLKDLFFKK